MRFMFVCGGTAGHINPALALAEKLKELVPDCELLFVGSGREMERRLIPAEGYRLENITITGFSRELSLSGVKYNIKTAKNLRVADAQSKKLLEEFRPDVVIGTGGYVCFPVLREAAKKGLPTVLHESNAVPGLTTKLLSSRVDDMLVSFPGARDNYRRRDNIRVVGTPVRGQFGRVSREEAKRLVGAEDMPLVVSFWGSLGADYMNEVIVDFISQNTKNRTFRHIHATGGGEEGLKKMKDRLARLGVTGYEDLTDIRPYINNMGVIMRASDIVMCRAGASTIAELTLVGAPSILVPSPNVTNNHQEKNAREMDRAGAAKMILEKGLDGKTLYDSVCAMLSDVDYLRRMSENALSQGVADSSDRIAEIILSHVS